MKYDLDRWVKSKAIAVVTGASAGIGAATAEQLVKHGLTVVGIARRAENVEELAKKLSKEKGKLIALKADLSNKDDIVKAFEWIKSNVGPVSILINNAAVFAADNMSEPCIISSSYESWKKQIDLNILGLCAATKEAIKQMRENNITGHIININSLAGHYVFDTPAVSMYTATKYAVTAITEALRYEIKNIGSRIKITSLSPGYVETEMTVHHPDNTEERKQELAKMPMLLADDIADGILYVLSTPERVQIQEIMIRPNGDPN